MLWSLAFFLTFAILGCTNIGDDAVEVRTKDEQELIEDDRLQDARLGVRNAHAMAYDRKNGCVVLFGGADEAKVCGDTWTFDGIDWQLADTTGPLPRTFPAMTWDETHQVVLLFGGNKVLFGDGEQDDTYLNDLWSWNGQSWRQLSASGPRPRAEAAMAYDASRQVTVFFGGYYLHDDELVRLGDTWEWDGNHWKQMTISGPSPRNGAAAMVYDPMRGKVVLFGRSSQDGLAATWTWDGSKWQPLEGGEAPYRYNAAMTFDAKRKTIIRFGGWDGNGRVADTWELHDTGWQRLEIAGPSARNHTGAVCHRAIQKIVLFGGHDGDNVFGDTWALDEQGWQQIGAAAKLRRVLNGH